MLTFLEFKETEIIKTIKELAKSKANTFKDIPVKIMANSVHIYSQILNLVPSASFCYKSKVKKRPWNTSNTLSKFPQIEGTFLRVNYKIRRPRY